MTALVLAALLAAPPAKAADPAAGGALIVESVAPGLAASRGGLRAGDVLQEWRRGNEPAAGGRLSSPFDLRELEMQQAPLGPVQLLGSRDGAPLRVLLPPSRWEVAVRWDAPAGAGTESPQRAAWLQWRAGDEAAQADHGDEAMALYRSAVALTDSLPAPYPSLIREACAQSLRRRSRFRDARPLIEEALARRQAERPEGVAVAYDLNDLGYVELQLGLREAARAHLESALGQLQRLAPDSLPVAATLHNLGSHARDEDITASIGFFTRALAIRERLEPGTVDWARTLQSLAMSKWTAGERSEARRMLETALATTVSVAPDSLELAAILGNLGTVSSAAGELTQAADYNRRSKDILERLQPESLALARTLRNLGLILLQQGDTGEAEPLFLRAEKIVSAVAPDHALHAAILEQLGSLAEERGDFEAAERPLMGAVAIYGAHQPDNPALVHPLVTLARVALQRGRLAEAEALNRRALALQADQSGRTDDWRASPLLGLGDVARLRGQRDQAEALYRQALAACELPRHPRVEVLHALGLLERDRNRLGRAAAYLRQAVDTIEGEVPGASPSADGRSVFASRYGDVAFDLVDVLVALRRVPEAFNALEESRARGLRAMLAQRDLHLAEVPAPLENERRSLAAAYDRALDALDEAPTAAARTQERAVLADLRQARIELGQRLREAAPGAAALRDPQPLEVAGARAALDPGTLLLSYATGPRRTHVFALGADGHLEVRTLPVGRDALRERVEALRFLLQGESSGGADLTRAERALFALLVKPLRHRLAAATRLLIVPDGPLRRLPFAALHTGRRLLVEWKAVHTTASATVYAEGRRRRSTTARTIRLVAFGDPVYPQASPEPRGTGTVVRAASSPGLALSPLPESRREIEAVAALFPGAVTHLGAEATEERAKALDRTATFVHFACHGIINERAPLDSALALSIPADARGRENGLLQAWEVIEQVHLDAELVTLASCESGLGQERAGEGLVGLARAFQYAGARSVLASLWSVRDEDTSALMRAFYGYLRDGRPKDEALRQAQVDVLRRGGTRAPTWAAFQLIGDWR